MAYARTFYYYHPDIFLDHMNGDETFSLFFFQRILIRLLAYFKYPFVVGVRGVGKSFIHFLFYMIKCVLVPNSSIVITAPEKYQADLIAEGTLNDIIGKYPFFRNEIQLNETGGIIVKKNQYYNVIFKNGSAIRIAHSKASLRGTRNSSSGNEESGSPTFDRQSYLREISPTLSNNRVPMNSKMDSTEIQGQKIEITNAQAQNSQGFFLMQQTFENMGKSSNNDMFIGMDYKMSALYNILNIDTFLKDKYDPNSNKEDFIRNWYALWTGFMSQQMINGDILRMSFNIPYPITQTTNDDWRYVLALDVASVFSKENSADTALVVSRFRFNSLKNDYEREVVNIEIYRNMTTEMVAKQLKILVIKYNAECLVVDFNGTGESITQELLKDHKDGSGSLGIIYDELFPELNNEQDLKAIQVLRSSELENCNKILYPLKANMKNTKDQKMNLTIKQLLTNRKIRFVDYTKNSIRPSSDVLKHFDILPEQESLVDEIKDIYINFNHLYDEISNVSLKENGVLELVDKTKQKDRYSAFKYSIIIIEQLILNSSYKPQSNVSYKNMAVKKNSSQSKGMTPEQKYIQELTGRKNGKRSSKSRRSIGAKIR